MSKYNKTQNHHASFETYKSFFYKTMCPKWELHIPSTKLHSVFSRCLLEMCALDNQ